MARQNGEDSGARGFEAMHDELEQLARRLEEGGLGLEESLALYEQSAALVERLRAVLDDAEVRVQRVRSRLDSRGAPRPTNGREEPA